MGYYHRRQLLRAGLVPLAAFVTGNPLSKDAVAETRRGIFDARSGKFLGTWGSLGLGDLQFQVICGLALDDQGNIDVADCGLKMVKKFRLP